jgi:IS605 OrfB family transposase
MSNDRTLIKTLVFQLSVQSDNERLLYEACTEARRVYNQSIWLAMAGVEWAEISTKLADETNLVKNTAQRIVDKALGAMANYEEADDVGLPSHTKNGPYPLRANYGEGYMLSRTKSGEIAFRISAKPYKHVTGTLDGAAPHRDILDVALTSDEWSIGTAEVLWRGGAPELHIDVTNTEQTVRDQSDSRTVVGVDVNEDNVALTALSAEGVADTLVIDFPELKFERHRYLTIRKRVQKAGKDSIHATLAGNEKRFVRDRLHKLSRHIIEWSRKFEQPCIVFEDLKEMRSSIDYGTRINRRLHRIPFRALQFYTSYKAVFEGIPTGWIDPRYTSQRCPMCGHTERANRKKKRFKCRSCGHQDHSDRCASVNIAMKGVKTDQDWNVPALNSLPVVRTVRRQASGAVDAPTVTSATDRGHHTKAAEEC